MKAKFLRLFSILAVCGLFFGFSACQAEGGDEESSSKKTEETKTDETKTDDTQTGKYKITYMLSYENTVPSTSTYKTIYFDEPYTITEDDLVIPEPKSYMTGEEWVFDGWWNQSSFISTKLTLGETIDTSITLSGFWRTRYSRNLSYYSQYDSEHCPENATVKENEVLTEENLPELSCEGHIFKGWWTTIYSDGESKEIPVTPGYRIPISGNGYIYLTAKWDQTVSFSTEYGTAPEAISGFYGSFTQLAETLSAGNYILTDDEGVRDFLGWKYNGRLLNLEAEENWSYSGNLEDDITVTAQWQKKKCTITFVTEHGTAPEPVVVDGGTSMDKIYEIYNDEKYKLTAEGYDFYGWSYNSPSIRYKGDYVICDDMQVSAGWWPKSYTVTFEANGPTKGKNSSTDTYYYDSLIGWADSSYSSSLPKYDDCELISSSICSDGNSEVSLYAVWVNDCAAQIWTMTASGTIKPEFDLTQAMLDEIGDALRYLYETRPDIKVSLDLSAQTQITKISSAFSGCANLTSINFPDSVTEIDSSAFKGCTSLIDVLIPNAVNKIGWGAFRNCTSLTSINIPDSVTEIDSYAFSGCTSLTSINIPDSVMKIGSYAFFDCTSLTSINIPDSVTEIDTYAFYGCSSLESITIASLGNRYYFYEIFGKNEDVPVSLKSVMVNSDKIPWFRECSSIESIVINGNPAEIDPYKFSGCTSLKCINIPDSVTKIGEGAFYDCTSLTSINIPASVTEIDSYVFYGCTNLKESYIEILDTLSLWRVEKQMIYYSPEDPNHGITKTNIGNLTAKNLLYYVGKDYSSENFVYTLYKNN